MRILLCLLLLLAGEAKAQPKEPKFIARRIAYKVIPKEPIHKARASKPKPVVILYTASWCPYCPAVMREMDALDLRGWNYRVETRLPSWVKKLPAVHWGKRVAYGSGAARIFSQEALTAKPKQEARRYPYGFSDWNWTYPGNISDHLQRGHGFDYDEIKNLSPRDRVRLHNWDHENGMYRKRYGRQSSTGTRPRTSAYTGTRVSCPTRYG